MLEASLSALTQLMEPTHFLYLLGGVLMGLFLGTIPGLGGLTGLSILLPFTFTMEPTQAMAMIVGLLSIISTGDTIPAVLFGIPGTVAAQATILDGQPMARNGEAGRALGAAFTSSLLGGIIGAAILGLSIPILRPLVLSFGSPEFFMLGLLGVSMVAAISGNAPLKGLAAGLVGMAFAMVGLDLQQGMPRWTFDVLYFTDGIDIIPVALGIFAVPELIEAIGRGTSIANTKIGKISGAWQGMCDAFRHWWLVARCSTLGVFVGIIPGLGSSVADWIAYGHALQTEKGARASFGKGDVRGVIAPECCNNAVKGGDLIPTIAFGIPGSANMALVLGAMTIQGLVPGTAMMTEHLDVTYTIVWSVGLANIFGAILCLMLTPQLARIAQIRIQVLVPLITAMVLVAAYRATASFWDIGVLLVFSALGYGMKHYGWPRAPLILGFVLSPVLEENLFTSMNRYGFEWLSRPVVIVLGLASIASVVYGFWPAIKHVYSRRMTISQGFPRPKINTASLFTGSLLVLSAVALAEATTWPGPVKLLPVVALVPAVAFCAMQMVKDVFSRGDAAVALGESAMDLVLDKGADSKQFNIRVVGFVIWIAALLAGVWLVGFPIALPVFIYGYQRFQSGESNKLAIGSAATFLALLLLVFHKLVHLRWPIPFIEYPQATLLSIFNALF